MKKEIRANGNKKNRLPFAVFLFPKKQNEKYKDYRQIFTNIISDRIKKHENV